MVLACVSTAKGPAAIAVVEVFGDGAVEVVRSIFKSDSGKQCEFVTGAIYTGNIITGDEIIDHVVAARTEDNTIEINCHGNPLIVEMVMEALSKAGAELVDTEKLISEKLSAKENTNRIQVEAEIEKLKSLSLSGVKAICESDLGEVAADWLERIDSLDLTQLKKDCVDILAASETARYLIRGCKAVIAGPPNSGKSTLLNYLCGREKAIVTDIAGTTRDWVSGSCRVGELAIELFDTAGLDASIIGESVIDAESQRRSMEILDQCDIVLLVLDPANLDDDFNFDVITNSGKKVITVYNKSDLGGTKSDGINISAMTGEGIKRLLESVKDELVGDGEIAKTICFTDRQSDILRDICKTANTNDARDSIKKLLGHP